MKTKILMCFVTAAALASGQNFYNFDCQTAGAVPALGGPGDCEGLTGADAFIETAPGCAGMPSNGANCAVVRTSTSAAFLSNMANGATIPRPLPANLPELRLPMAAGTTLVSFDWRAYFNDSGPYNDGYDVSVCDAAGNRIETVLRGDSNTDGGFTCLGFNSLVFQLAAATPAGAYLSVCAYNEQDGCCGTGTFFAIDRLRFSAGNDECVGAVPITCTVYNQSNIGATTSGPGSCSMSAGVWYAFTASQTGPHAFSTMNNSFMDTVISVFSGCEGALLGCNDQFGGTSQSQVSLSLTAGQTVYVEVGGWLGATGAFNLNIIQPFALIYTSPQPGTLEICITGGTPNTVFFAPATLAPGNFPTGSFYGIDISLFDLLGQIGAGAPFIGLTDGNGVAQFGPFGPGLSGLTLYGVALNNVASPGFTASAPVSFTIP